MRPETWMEDVLGSRSKVRILRLLSGDPGRSWTEREVAASVSMSPNTVNLAVRDLRDLGLLEFRRVGRTHLLRLLPGTEIAGALRETFDRERRVWKRVEAAIARAALPRTACYLYGSSARGTAGGDSDIDLLVVASTQEKAEEAAHRIRAAVAAVFPARLDVIPLGADAARSRSRGPLLKSVLREGRPLTPTRIEGFL